KLKTLLGSILLLCACEDAPVEPPRGGPASAVAQAAVQRSPCARLAAIDVSEKIGSCSLAPSASLDEQECLAQTAAYSGHAETSLPGFAPCLEVLPACQPGRESAFQRTVDSCAQLL